MTNRSQEACYTALCDRSRIVLCRFACSGPADVQRRLIRSTDALQRLVHGRVPVESLPNPEWTSEQREQESYGLLDRASHACWSMPSIFSECQGLCGSPRGSAHRQPSELSFPSAGTDVSLRSWRCSSAVFVGARPGDPSVVGGRPCSGATAANLGKHGERVDKTLSVYNKILFDTT